MHLNKDHRLGREQKRKNNETERFKIENALDCQWSFDPSDQEQFDFQIEILHWNSSQVNRLHHPKEKEEFHRVQSRFSSFHRPFHWKRIVR